MFTTIVKSFDICFSSLGIFHIKIKLALTFYGPIKAENHKKSHLSALRLSVQPNVCFYQKIEMMEQVL